MRQQTTRKPVSRKMKLTFVRNTVDGVDQIGCRASGIYNGHHIECTAWQPVANVSEDSFDCLEALAKGRYNSEARKIDDINKRDR